jgi:MSHA biogenesis protein MshP
MSLKSQRGFAIISAIFILVVLSILGAIAVTVSTSQQVGSALDLQGARAYQAARAGTEWGLSQAINAPSGVCTAGAGTSTNLGTINNMTTTVLCQIVATGSAVEVGLGTIYLVTATACSIPNGSSCPGTNPAANNYVERRISVVADTSPQ